MTFLAVHNMVCPCRQATDKRDCFAIHCNVSTCAAWTYRGTNRFDEEVAAVNHPPAAQKILCSFQ